MVETTLVYTSLVVGILIGVLLYAIIRAIINSTKEHKLTNNESFTELIKALKEESAQIDQMQKQSRILAEVGKIRLNMIMIQNVLTELLAEKQR